MVLLGYINGIMVLYSCNVFQNTAGDDRLAATAMSVNSLINTWTVFDSVKKTLSWITGV